MNNPLETAWGAWVGRQGKDAILDPKLAYAAGWRDATQMTVRSMTTISGLVPALRDLADALEDDD
jgi:hypothetical protein